MIGSAVARQSRGRQSPQRQAKAESRRAASPLQAFLSPFPGSSRRTRRPELRIPVCPSAFREKKLRQQRRKRPRGSGSLCRDKTCLLMLYPTTKRTLPLTHQGENDGARNPNIKPRSQAVRRKSACRTKRSRLRLRITCLLQPVNRRPLTLFQLIFNGALVRPLECHVFTRYAEEILDAAAVAYHKSGHSE